MLLGTFPTDWCSFMKWIWLDGRPPLLFVKMWNLPCWTGFRLCTFVGVSEDAFLQTWQPNGVPAIQKILVFHLEICSFNQHPFFWRSWGLDEELAHSWRDWPLRLVSFLDLVRQPLGKCRLGWKKAQGFSIVKTCSRETSPKFKSSA